MQPTKAPSSFIHRPSTAFWMAAIAGFSDVLGFIGINRLFLSHITGNIVVAIAEIIYHSQGVASKIIAIPLFIVVALLITAYIESKGQTKTLLATYFVMEALLLAGLMMMGVFMFPHLAINSWTYLAGGMLGVCAMAIHNTLLRTFMTHFPPCTVMTGNLTQFIVDVVSFSIGWRLPHSVEKRHNSRVNIKKHGNVLFGFSLGGICAAVGYVWIGFWAIIPVILILLMMAVKVLRSP